MNRRVLLVAMAILAVGCSGAGPTASVPAASGSVAPDASTSVDGFQLRTAIHQSIPPPAAFQQQMPPLAIADGNAILVGPVDAIAPGPLLPPMISRPISDAGIRQLIADASAAGLLTGPTDLTGGSQPGSLTAEIAFIIDGAARTVFGDPDRQIVCVTTPCVPAPGTPEAFGGFWSTLLALEDHLGGELGEPVPYEIERLAVLLTEPPPEPNLPIEYADWPIEGLAMRDFGSELAGSPPSTCGVVAGEELGPVLEAFSAANAATIWRDGTGAERVVVARPLFPGEEDPCG